MHTNTNILLTEACRVLSSPNELLIDILLRAVIKDNGVNEIWTKLTRFLPKRVARQSPTVAEKQLLPPSKGTN